MLKRIQKLILLSTLVSSTLAGQSTVASSITELWNDPSFVKQFVGSYGFLAGYEPSITEEEKEALRTLTDLIKASPVAAINELKPQVKNSSSAAFDFILANLYFQEGNLPEAEKYYKNAIIKYPNFRRAYKNLGLVQVQALNFDAAIPTISKALELGEVDGRAYGLLGYGYFTQQKYYPAEAAYRQAILMQPDNKDWKIGLAQTLLETARYGDAIALFDTLLTDNPQNADYWLLQSNAYLGNDQSLQAAKNLEIVRRLNAADFKTMKLLGDIYLNSNSADLALNAYLSAIDIAGSENAESLVRVAELLQGSGNYDQSMQMIAKITSSMESQLSSELKLDLLTTKAKIARAEGDDEAAVATLQQIIAEDALNGDAIIELAKYYAELGDLARATNRFEQAQKIDAYERPALVAHAQALVREGKYSDALPLLKRAINLKADANLEEFFSKVERAARTQS